MKLSKCPACHKVVSKSAISCPSCAHPIKGKADGSFNLADPVHFVALGICLVFIAGLALYVAHSFQLI
jgi:hypothetical protein